MSLLRLEAIVVGDEPDDWEAAGFTVDGSRIDIGDITVECLGDGSRPRWRLSGEDGLPDSIDGLSTQIGASVSSTAVPPHRNEAVDIDHVVLASPDLDRTTEAFAALGVECRRIREVLQRSQRLRVGRPVAAGGQVRRGDGVLGVSGPRGPTCDRHRGPAGRWPAALLRHAALR